jgi:DNA-binding IclR family transcriptional regulator
LIAHLPEAQVEEMVRRQGLLRHNENTIASLKKLRQACDLVQQSGYAVDDEEEEIGIRCIGTPVFNGRGDVVAAISVSGSTTHVENVAALAVRVQETALAVSRHLGLSEGEREDAGE